MSCVSTLDLTADPFNMSIRIIQYAYYSFGILLIDQLRIPGHSNDITHPPGCSERKLALMVTGHTHTARTLNSLYPPYTYTLSSGRPKFL